MWFKGWSSATVQGSNCSELIWGICFEPATSNGGSSIFGFSEYLATLALLLVVYAISDFKYRYRFQLTRYDIKKIAFSLSIIIGVFILLIDLWFHNNWLLPSLLNDATNIKIILGAIFLSLVGYMNFIAFLKPVKFKASNAMAYFSAVHNSIGKGDEVELRVVADELGYSAKNIIELAAQRSSAKKGSKDKGAAYAHDLLLLIANKKFCKVLVEHSPWVIEVLFKFVSKEKSLPSVFGLFTKNIGVELIINANSPLQYELNGYEDGYFGYTKPISNSVFGNFDLVEFYAGNHNSPFNIMFSKEPQLGSNYVEVYCSSVLIFVEAYLSSTRKQEHSYAFFQVLGDIESFSSDLYLLDGAEEDFYKSSTYENTRRTVDFVRDLVELMDKYEIKPSQPLRSKELSSRCLYDRIANLIMKLLLYAAQVTKPRWTAWDIQHNMIWSRLFEFNGPSEGWKIIKFKVRRLLYDDIITINETSLFKGARYLGLCLNILGVKEEGFNREHDFYPLQKLMLKWVKGNYLKLREERPKVADACIQGSITYDVDKKMLIKTFSSDYKKKSDCQTLQL